MSKSDFARKRKIVKVRRFFADKFNLDEDGASQQEVMDNVNKGVEFRGTNLWILIFAAIIASLALNINSVAVLIGAMLISPLMGPIMGLGLSLGINDFELLKRSFKNFSFMILVTIGASTVYFLITPISTPQTEILSRTSPTTYDVLIAFFGGLAGIIAQSRKDRTSTVIPGVAIATTLMPPLCIIGYGIATWQLSYAAGAFYLFLINTVFIAFATFFVVRFLRYRKKTFLDKSREKQVKRYMAVILVATIIPSVIIGYGLVQKSLFESNADRFVSRVIKFENSPVLSYKKDYNRHGSKIELVMMGDQVSTDAIKNITAQLTDYGLADTELIIRQPAVGDNIEDYNFAAIGQSFEQLLEEKNNRIHELEDVLGGLYVVPSEDISKEIGALSEDVINVSLSKNPVYTRDGVAADTVLVCLLTVDGNNLSDEKKGLIARWLKTRTNSDNVKIYVRGSGE